MDLLVGVVWLGAGCDSATLPESSFHNARSTYVMPGESRDRLVSSEKENWVFCMQVHALVVYSRDISPNFSCTGRQL